MPEPIDDLPSLEALQSKIDQAKPQEAKEASAALEYNKDFSLAMRFLVELLAGIGIGAFLGYTLDGWLKTLPVFLILGLLLGLAAGIRNMMRSAKYAEKEQMDEDQQSS